MSPPHFPLCDYLQTSCLPPNSERICQPFQKPQGWSSCPHLWTNSRSMEIIVGWMTRPGHMSPPRPRSCMLWVLSHDWLFATPWTAACQAPLSMEFSRQEHWSGLPFPTPGDLTYPAIKPESLVSHALAGEFLTTALPEEPRPRS